MAETYYEILKVSPGANYDEIDRAYRQMYARFNSDKERLKKIQVAYNTIANPSSRKKYDQQLVLARDSAKRTDASPTQGDKPFPSTSRPPSSSSSRGRTVFLDEDESPGGKPRDETKYSPKPPVVAPPNSSPGARQKTEFVGPPVETPPEPSTAAPKEEGGRTQKPPATHTPVNRQRTEFVDEAAATESTLFNDTPFVPDETGERTRIAPVAFVEVTFKSDEKPRIFQIQEGDNLIGRPPREGPRPQVELEDPDKYISRQHATLRAAGGSFVLIDHGSKNGTYLNKQRLIPNKEYPLGNGDTFQIEGRNLLLKLVD